MSKTIRDDIGVVLDSPLPWDKLRDCTVLVTGASGMVGGYIVRSLLELNRKHSFNVKVIAIVRSLDRAKSSLGEYSNHQGIKFIENDVSNPLKFDEKIDIVIHAASPASPDKFKIDPVGVIKANILGSINMLEVSRSSNAIYCFISTMEVYGHFDSEKDAYVSEEDYGRLDSLDLRSAYPESKRAAENLAVAYGNQYGVDYRIARMTHTYGPGMDIKDTRVQAEFIRKGLEGEDIVLKTDGSLTRTYTYISDAISGIFFTILKGQLGGVYNIANEESKVSIKDLANHTIKATGGISNLKFDIAEQSSVAWSKTRGVYVDCSKLRSLGWRASVSIEDGMNRTVKHNREVLDA